MQWWFAGVWLALVVIGLLLAAAAVRSRTAAPWLRGLLGAAGGVVLVVAAVPVLDLLTATVS